MGTRRLVSLLATSVLIAAGGTAVAGLDGPVAAAAKKKPDLKVTAPSGAPASVAPGAALTATVTVTSTAPVKRTTTTLTLSTDETVGPGDVILAQAATKLKKAGKSKRAKAKPKATLTLSGTVPAGTAPGSYRLIACADATGKVKEKSEKNNCASTGVTVATPGPTDTTPPDVPTLGALAPASPSSNPTPTVTITGEPGARVDVYRQAGCGGTVGASITLPAGGTAGLPVPVNHNTTTVLTARAVDAAGNSSGCSGSRSYLHDDIPPAAPTVQLPTPFFAGRDQYGTYRGTAEAGSTVVVQDFFTGCFGTPDISTSAANFASGGIYVPGDAHAAGFQAVDAAGNKSPCVDLPRGRRYVTSQDGQYTETTSNNDSRPNAQQLELDPYGLGDPVSVVGSLSAAGGSDPTDYYRVDLPDSGYTLVAEARARYDGCSSQRDPYLALYDAGGTLVAYNDDAVPGSNYCSRLDGLSTPSHSVGNVALPAGTYYLGVSSVGSGFDYELAFGIATPGWVGESEPNNTTAQANGLTAPYDAVIGTISGTGDVDYYSFVADGTTVRVDVLASGGTTNPTCTGSGANRADPAVSLLDSNGAELIYNDDIGGGNYCARLTYGSLVAGQRYYVKVIRAPAAGGAATSIPYVLMLRR
jgi:hypothetical protein